MSSRIKNYSQLVALARQQIALVSGVPKIRIENLAWKRIAAVCWPMLTLKIDLGTTMLNATQVVSKLVSLGLVSLSFERQFSCLFLN